MQSLMTISIGAGYIFSLLLSLYFVRKYLPLIAYRFTCNKRESNVIINSGYIFSAVSVIPALFLGSVIGGSLGGSYGAIVFELIGLGKAGIPVGLTLGLILVTVTVVQSTMLLGVFVGWLFIRVFMHEQAT